MGDQQENTDIYLRDESSLPFKTGRREEQEGRKIQVCAPGKTESHKGKLQANPSALDTIYLVKTCLWNQKDDSINDIPAPKSMKIQFE